MSHFLCTFFLAVFTLLCGNAVDAKTVVELQIPSQLQQVKVKVIYLSDTHC